MGIDAQLIELYCPQCGYNLRGITSSRCPECGLEIDRTVLMEPRIPWVHRSEIGWPSAFFRTVAMVIRRPRMLAQEVGRPVGYSDAQKFRWLVGLAAFLPLAAWAIVLRALGREFLLSFLLDQVTTVVFSLKSVKAFPGWFDMLLCYVAGILMWPVSLIALGAFVAGVTGLPSYFFHPSAIEISRQDRGIAISHYLCAPLSLLGFPAVLVGAAWLTQVPDVTGVTVPLQIYAGIMVTLEVSLPAILGIWLVNVLRVMRWTTGSSAWRVLGMAIALPLMVMLWAVVTLGVIPLILGFIRLVVESYLG